MLTLLRRAANAGRRPRVRSHGSSVPVAPLAIAVPLPAAKIAGPAPRIAASALAARTDPRPLALSTHDVLLLLLDTADLTAVLAPRARLGRAAVVLPEREGVPYVFAAPAAAAAHLDRLQAGRVPGRKRDRHAVVTLGGSAPRAFPALGIIGPLEEHPRVGTLVSTARAATRVDIAPAMTVVVAEVPIVPPDGTDQRPENPARTHLNPPAGSAPADFLQTEAIGI